MNSVLRTAFLAWATACLITSPLMAGMRCLDCCSSNFHTGQAAAGTEVPASSACCSHHAHADQEHTGLNSTGGLKPCGQDPNGCQTCNHCSAAKPAPVDRTTLVQPGELPLQVAWLEPQFVSMVPQTEPVPDRVPRDTGSCTQPSLQVLLCCWLK